MARIRYIASAFATLTGVLLLSACNIEAAVAPCYSQQNWGESSFGINEGKWFKANGIDGNWHLMSVDGKPLPYSVPFSSLNPKGVIVATGGGIRFDTEDRGWDDDCKRLHSERGTAVATYDYTEGGVIRPRGLAAGTFNADHDNNTAVLGAVGKTQNVTLTRDQGGAVIRITATDIPVKKWGVELTFTLVFERTPDPFPAVVPP